MTMEARGAQEAIEAVDFPAASIDRVICNSGLAYLQDTPAALRRYRGWLRPGGRRAPCLARAPLSVGRRLHSVPSGTVAREASGGWSASHMCAHAWSRRASVRRWV